MFTSESDRSVSKAMVRPPKTNLEYFYFCSANGYVLCKYVAPAASLQRITHKKNNVVKWATSYTTIEFDCKLQMTAAIQLDKSSLNRI